MPKLAAALQSIIYAFKLTGWAWSLLLVSQLVEGAPAKKGGSETVVPPQAATQASGADCEDALVAKHRHFNLIDFVDVENDSNPAFTRPMTVMNAAEKTYAQFMLIQPRRSRDPLFRNDPVMVYPVFTGELAEAGSRLVVGQERAIQSMVEFVGSLARGDKSGKAWGAPGPGGTGKTELMYVAANIAKNLDRTNPVFKEYSYRFKNLHEIPFLQPLVSVGRDGYRTFYDPDIKRSPFTLLREDIQDEIIARATEEIENRHGMIMSRGWKGAEPKSRAILKAIFEHLYPQYSEGTVTIDDLSREEYLDFVKKLDRYVVVVPKASLLPHGEPKVFRLQAEDPNEQALFAATNTLNSVRYGANSPFAVDYTGQLFRLDGGILMMDELYRNPQSLLGRLLEVVQNQIIQTDSGEAVQLDIVPIWNSNDEAIDRAREEGALKASLDRTSPSPMRLVIPPHQIEQLIFFQVGAGKFLSRKLGGENPTTELQPFDVNEVYPTPDAQGVTQTAYKRFAISYKKSKTEQVLIAPLTLNYISWIASASRMVTDVAKLLEHKSELNLVTQNPNQYLDPIYRLRVALGEITPPTGGERAELSKLNKLLKEGQTGLTSRQVEDWVKGILNKAYETGVKSITPRFADIVFAELLDNGKIVPENLNQRAHWNQLRQRVKQHLLLPKLSRDVQRITSGGGYRAELIYNQMVRELIALNANPNANKVSLEDSSELVMIDMARLQAITAIYKETFGKQFEVSFVVSLLAGAKGSDRKDPQLFEAIEVWLARTQAQFDDISGIEAYYKGESQDPQLTTKVRFIEENLAEYGYDQTSFREAVAFVNQMNQELRSRNQGPR